MGEWAVVVDMAPIVRDVGLVPGGQPGYEDAARANPGR